MYILCRQVLTNLLDTDDFKCKIGSLRVLREISVHPDIRRAITMMGGIEVMNILFFKKIGQFKYKFLPITGFEPWTSGIRSDRSTNWATTTAHYYYYFLYPT